MALGHEQEGGIKQALAHSAPAPSRIHANALQIDVGRLLAQMHKSDEAPAGAGQQKMVGGTEGGGRFWKKGMDEGQQLGLLALAQGADEKRMTGCS